MVISKSKSPGSSVAQASAPFPRAYPWLIDEFVPAWVKRRYSPKPAWKDRPFTEDDARFFAKGLRDLSEILTTERDAPLTGRGGSALPAYFSHPRHRSSYLLYYLPLQSAKFLCLFDKHRAALDKGLLEAGRPLRIVDLGSGPGTASIALLLWLLDRPEKLPKKIEFEWWDADRAILKDGEALWKDLLASFPALQGREITLTARVGPWQKVRPETADLVLFGNVLNESPRSEDAARLSDWVTRTRGAGTLIVEPARRRTSQFLSRFRDELLTEFGADAAGPPPFWGPCPHAGLCPLTGNRDWCHFSERTEIPGQWFNRLSRALGPEREWLKFSYLWWCGMQAGDPRPEPVPKTQRLVLTDPFAAQESKPHVLLCRPETPERLEITPSQARLIRRGMWIDPEKLPEAKIMPVIAAKAGRGPRGPRPRPSRR